MRFTEEGKYPRLALYLQNAKTGEPIFNIPNRIDFINKLFQSQKK